MLRRSNRIISCFGIVFIATALSMAEAQADDCQRARSLSDAFVTLVGSDSMAAKLHSIVLLNDVGEGYAKESCPAILSIPEQGEITFGFGQFSLSQANDRRLLLDLMLKVQPETFGPHTRSVLDRDGGRLSNSDRQILKKAEDAIRVRLLSVELQSQFLLVYQRRLEQRLASIDGLHKVMATSNPILGTGPVSDFIRLYSADAHRLLGDLDDFADLVNKKQPYVCNLLCEARFVPAYRMAERVTALDLPRYLHSATCFGLAPRANSRHQLLRRFENIVKVAGTSPEDLLLIGQPGSTATQFDLFFARYDLHDMGVRSVGPAVKLQELKLRAGALLKDEPETVVVRGALREQLLMNAAIDACEEARGLGWQSVRPRP